MTSPETPVLEPAETSDTLRRWEIDVVETVRWTYTVEAANEDEATDDGEAKPAKSTVKSRRAATKAKEAAKAKAARAKAKAKTDTAGAEAKS